MSLDIKLADTSRTLKMYEGRLQKLDIVTLWDLLFHLPFRYDDFSLVSPIAKLQTGETVSIQGQIISVNNDYSAYSKKIQKALISDETGTIEATWFNQPFLLKILKPGTNMSLSGKVTSFKGKRMFQPTEYEVLYESTRPLHTGRLVPIYPETRGVSSKWLRRQIYTLLTKYQNEIEDVLPEEVRQQFDYDDLFTALQTAHFPKNLEDVPKARERLAFDELLLFQLTNLKRRHQWQKKAEGTPMEKKTYEKDVSSFIKSLPFSLTNAQQNAIEAIFDDLTKHQPMNRLLQGDVGSGKTIVAAIAMFLAHKNNMQSVLMAPTEILAEQHFKTISNLLEPFGVSVQLVTGSKKPGIKSQESKIKKKSKSLDSKLITSDATFDILIGTHALLNETVTFSRLGLVIIDEQQRFGVEQRATIRGKGENPHLLTMTATPIPRTVALTMYGDLDLSYLSEMPKGRKTIKTWLVPPLKRDNAYTWIETQIKETDSQAFIICPFIEESESMSTIKAATSEFERLKKDVFPNLKLALLHGKQKAKEKDEILKDFKDKKYDVLVATPVVEVGIDIPNATIIVIEASERFGLSQLHQLRGRVGRGDKQSYCLLFTESKNPQTISKLKAMETIHVGAKLAELDLKLRGPGEMYGTAQSGQKIFKIASFGDTDLIQKSQLTAENLFKNINKHKKLKKKLESQVSKTVTPD